jgi:hypothetical protein
LGTEVRACHPRWGSTNRLIADQVGLGIKSDPISNITSARAKGVAQVVQRLSSLAKHEALSSSPSIPMFIASLFTIAKVMETAKMPHY